MNDSVININSKTIILKINIMITMIMIKMIIVMMIIVIIPIKPIITIEIEFLVKITTIKNYYNYYYKRSVATR